MTKSSNALTNVAGLTLALALSTANPSVGLMAFLASIGGNLSSQYIYDLMNPKLQEYWATDNGILNHDIQKAFIEAMDKAILRIEEAYWQEHDDLSEKERNAIKYFLEDITNDTKKKLLRDVSDPLQFEQVQELLRQNNTQHFPTLLKKWDALSALAISENAISDDFMRFFKEHFTATLQDEFKEAIKANDKAKAALQLLFYESAKNSLNTLEEGQIKLLKKVDEQALQIYAYGETWKQAIGRFEVNFAKIQAQNEQELAKLDQLIQENRELKQLIQEIRLSSSTQLPNFTASTKFQNFQKQLKTIEKDMAIVVEEITEIDDAIVQEEKATTRKILEKNLAALKDKQLQLSQDKATITQQLKEFIKDVLQLANTFSKDQLLQTERLQKARTLFLAGRLDEMDALLEEETLEKETEAAKNKLKTLAQEYTIKAQSANIQKAEGWYKETVRLYKKAFETQENYDTCFNLAYFLKEHNQFQDVEYYYLRALEHTQDIEQTSGILNNLGLLHRAKNELAKAEEAYNEALKIYRELAEINPQAFLPYVATTLNNLAVLHRAKNELAKAEEAYNEALKIRRELASVNPQAFELDVAMTCINLGIFYLQNKVDRELSIGYAKECLVLCEGYLGRVYRAQQYSDLAKRVLDKWNI